MAETKTLGIAMIGDGLMAKEHSIAWRSLRAVYGDIPFEPRLVTIVHPDSTRAAKAAKQYGFEKSTTSWEEAVRDPDVHIVNIVTPNYAHKDPAILAASLGKHIWAEKPLGLGLAQALEMAEAAENAKIATQVGFTYVHNPGIALAKQLIERGELGEIFSFTGFFSADTMIDPNVPFTWRTDIDKAGHGALGDLGSHMIALAQHLLGPIAKVNGLMRTVVEDRKDVSGKPQKVQNDDHAITLVEFAGGATGAFQASRVLTGRAFEVSFTITGTKGAIRFSQQDNHKLEVSLESDGLDTHGWRTIELGPGHGDYGHLWPMSGINIGLHELKLFELKEFVDSIAHKTPVAVDFRKGADVEKVVEAIAKSATTRVWENVS